MATALLGTFKHTLTLAGAGLSEPTLHQFQMVLNYMKLGRWMRRHDFRFQPRLRDRTAVFDSLAKRIRDRRVLYLEFGVFEGASMRYWSDALKHPQSVLHGFDSFEGLPEDFDVNGPLPKGHFNVDGKLPQIDDPRVKFFKGWFEDVLPTYEMPEHEQLVVTMDADLYSSTLYVLRFLRPWIKPGTYIYFDDLSRPEHEPRAFDEFMRESGLRFAPFSAEQSLNRAVFECLGPAKNGEQHT